MRRKGGFVSEYSREMALVQVAWNFNTLRSISEIARLFRAEVKRTTFGYLIIQVTGTPEGKKVDEFIGLMKKYGIIAIKRSKVLTMDCEDSYDCSLDAEFMAIASSK
jgi:acetolactate synthase small subunit